MARIVVVTSIQAPAERCFDLARSIDLHVETQRARGEEAVAGVTSGLIELGQEVTFRARHFGLVHTLTSRVVAFDRPRHFRDSQVRGPFRRFDHDHIFRAAGDDTLMEDVFDFNSPLGPLGWLADHIMVKRSLTRLLQERADQIRRVAESDDWRRVLRVS